MKYLELTTKDGKERIAFNPCHIHFREIKKTGECEILSPSLKAIKVQESFDWVKAEIERITYNQKNKNTNDYNFRNQGFNSYKQPYHNNGNY